jgi:hypothetical protein
MDYSQFRRSGAIDTGPLADAQDWFNSTGVGKVANAVGGGNDDNRWASLADPNNGFQQGSLADQLGGNQVMDSGQQSSTPDDTGYDDQGGITQNPSPVGEILGNETDESGGYDSGGNWQGLDYGYAEGGAVNDDTDDGRAVPKGAAQDQHTDGLASALQTIDDVMMHGYKINGLTGQSQQMPQSASAGGAQAPAFARGGLVPNAPGTITPPSFTGTPYQNFMASARQRATAARSQPMPSASPSAPTPTVPTNGTGVQDPAQSGQAIGGTAIAPGTYQGHRFDDGGAVEDDDQQGAIPDQPGQAPQQAQPQPQDDPNGGWQGGIPTMDNIRNSMRGAPSPADAMVPHVKRILNLIQGGGAMPIPQAQQLEHQSGEADPNMAKIKTAATLAQSHGPDAAWSYLQSLRKQYDLNKTNAAVKAAKGNIPQSTIAATNAMHNVLDGTSVHFSPAQGGVRVQVKRIGPSSGSSSQRFDDGGSVEDANGNDAQPISDKPSGAIPETGGADISGALASVCT